MKVKRVKMNTLIHIIWALVIVQVVEYISCQEYNGDILRYQQLAPNEGQVEAITSYSTNIVQRDPSGQSVSSVNVQYQMTEDSNKKEEQNSNDRPRRRKIYRIKNPFQNEQENTDLNESKDSDTGTSASNQYAAMQYSLPPNDFLHQMRAENQFFHQQQQLQQQQQLLQQQQQFQQQQLQQQLSTPAPGLGFTVTPHPQYQYSTVSTLSFDHNNQHQPVQFDSKPVQPMYYSNLNYPLSSSNSFKLDSVHSTPAPITPYVSTPAPINQYVATPTTSYVSSSSPVFLSTQPNLQQYFSSSILPIQSSSDYSNRFTSTVGSNSINYDAGDVSKRMHIDHYDNSANGIRYPTNIQQQYQNEYPSSTPIPSSSPYSHAAREAWQSSFNAGINALTKSLQEASLSQYQSSPYSAKQQEPRIETNPDALNSDIHRMASGDFPAANNIYYNYVQPDYTTLSKMKNNPLESEKEKSQLDVYSNGDYGWKISDKKSSVNQNSGSSNNFVRHSFGSSTDGGAVSQVSFQMDTSKPYNYDQNAKTSLENKNSQDFAKAAAKAHENLKQQQIYNNNYNSNLNGYNSQIQNLNDFYNNDNQKNKYDPPNSNSYSYTHSDFITASPFYNTNAKENSTPDNRPKQHFDHAKALKDIVPMDASNVVQNSDAQTKSISGFGSANSYKTVDFDKDQHESNSKQSFKSITDAFYKDKKSIYGLNSQTKPEDFVTVDTTKLQDINNYNQYYKKPQSQETSFTFGGYSTPINTLNYLPQLSSSVSDGLQFTSNFQRPENQIPTDILSILKLNDVPYKLTQGLSSDVFRLQNNNFDQGGSISISTPLPIKLNQNLGSHQLDITSSLISKLMNNKQQLDSLSSINGFKIANPYNVDLKLVAEMLKGKTNIDDSHLTLPRDQFSHPINLDLSQLQYLLRNENSPSPSGLGSPFFDISSSGRFPYQGVKYSRSQEEEESLIPIAEASNSHLIGAVIEEDPGEHEITVDLTAQGDESIPTGFTDDRPKKVIPEHSEIKVERPRHPNTLASGRFRKYPKTIEEPYPLLKPPPPMYRNRVNILNSERYKRRRPMKAKMIRGLKGQALHKTDSGSEAPGITIPVLLKPPPVNSAKMEVKSKK